MNDDPAKSDQERSNAVEDIPVKVFAILGTATMKVSQLLKMGRGAVVELDRKTDEPVSLIIDDKPIALAEVVLVDDERIGVQITDLIRS